VGNGSDMFNAGVSFYIGRGKHSLRSQSAVAAEVNSLRNTVEAQNAEIAAQREEIRQLKEQAQKNEDLQAQIDELKRMILAK